VPLGGETPRLEENLTRLCAAGAPVVAGLGPGRGEALAAVGRVRERTAAGTLTLVTASPLPGNRKIATLIRMLPEAREEIFIFTDGDIGVPEGYLEAVLAPFADPDVGLVTCPYRSVGGRTLASRVDAVITNTMFLPSVALAARVEGVRFALGATVAIRRTVLDAIGGLEPLLEVLADDWSLADGARRAGHRVVLAPLLLDHHVGAPGWPALWRRHLRWARTMRAVRPSGYAGTVVAHGCAPALGLLMLGGWNGVAAGALALWALVRTGSVLLNARRTGCGALDLLLLPVADLLALGLFVGGHCGRTVHWGESRLRVGRSGAIVASESLEEAAPQTEYGT
jgi:ceramide glucosyltransferase